MKLPRIMIGGEKSGCGKTLITCALLLALQKRGLRPASFKCGPDYIDPMFHQKVLGTPSGNLDTFFVSPRRARLLLAGAAGDCQVAVLEGVMGYYDGLGGVSETASSFDVARATGTPAVLVLDAKGASLSLAARVLGFLRFRPDHQLAGVILNRMSPSFYPRIKAEIEKLGVEVLGYLPPVREVALESRHLGLLLPEEIPSLRERLELLAETLEKTVEVDRLLALAGEAKELAEEGTDREWEAEDEAFSYRAPRPVRIGLARDQAFCFHYGENLRLLERMGAALLPFSPLSDEHLPKDLDGLILYGGYPELHARRLSENRTLREEIRRAIGSGLPCLAECGGFLYLHRELEDMEGSFWPMAGVLPGRGSRTGSLRRFGYLLLTPKESLFGKERVRQVPSHEFHTYETSCDGKDFLAEKPLGGKSWECIVAREDLIAGFPHFYYPAVPALPKAFLERCLEAKALREGSGAAPAKDREECES